MWKGLWDVAGCGDGGGGERSAGGGSVRAADRTPLRCATQRFGNGFEPRAPFSNICENTGRRRQNFAKMMRSTCTVLVIRGESQGTIPAFNGQPGTACPV